MQSTQDMINEKRNKILIVTLPAGLFFVLVMPIIIVKLSSQIGFLNTYKFFFGVFNYLIGGMLIFIGLPVALWTVYVQIKKGLGTPIPVLPPEKLLVKAPYSYCRNPVDRNRPR